MQDQGKDDDVEPKKWGLRCSTRWCKPRASWTWSKCCKQRWHSGRRSRIRHANDEYEIVDVCGAVHEQSFTRLPFPPALWRSIGICITLSIFTISDNFIKEIFKTPYTNGHFVGCQTTIFTSQPRPTWVQMS